MPGLTVRPFRLGDGDAAAAAVRAAYEQLASPGYLARIAAVTERSVEVPVHVAELDGRVVGCVTLVPGPGPYHEIAGPDEAEFRVLAVHPSAQGRGAGAALVRACADEARALGRTGLVCSSGPRMVAAHQLYARLGFQRAPERDWSPLPGLVLRVFELPLSRPSGR